MSDREAFLRRFHGERPGITSAALARHGEIGESYRRLAAAVPIGRVLDLGCGDSHLLALLGPDAIGVDLAPSGRLPMRVAGRAQALPFADAAFDACVCHLAFMLFDDLPAVVGELRRVVVPGGRFAAVLGGGPVEPAGADDAFHRFLAIAPLHRTTEMLGDRRASTVAGWAELFGRQPSFERFELDLSGPFEDVWRFLGASYQLEAAAAPAVRDRLRDLYAGWTSVPCRVAMWLATLQL